MRVECEACRGLAEARISIDGDTVRATCSACQHVTVATVAPTEPRAELRAEPPGVIDDAAVPVVVRDAWAAATEQWDDLARHDELLRLVTIHASYAWAAGRYRTRGREPMAERQLARLRRAAEATLLASATARQVADDKPYRSLRSVLALMIVAVVVGVVYAMAIRERRPSAPNTTTPVQPLAPGQPVSPSTIR